MIHLRLSYTFLHDFSSCAMFLRQDKNCAGLGFALVLLEIGDSRNGRSSLPLSSGRTCLRSSHGCQAAGARMHHMQVLCKSYASHNSAIAKNRNDLKDVAITKKQNLSPFWSIESYWVGRHWLYFPHSLARFARAHGTWPAENAIESAWSCDKGTGWKRFAAATDWIRLDHLSFDVAWMNIKSMYNIV